MSAYSIGDWSNGMIGVSKTFGGSSILSSPVKKPLEYSGFLFSKLNNTQTKKSPLILYQIAKGFFYLLLLSSTITFMCLQNHIQIIHIFHPVHLFLPGYALDRLVTVSSMHCCTSTSVLSTSSSSRGLTNFSLRDILS